MSWNCQRRLITDAKRPLGLRYMALLHAIEHYTYTTNTGFESVCEQLGQLHGFTHGGKNSTSVIEAAFGDLDAARNEFLLKLRAFTKVRQREKAEGRRQPNARRVRELYNCPRLGSPVGHGKS